MDELIDITQSLAFSDPIGPINLFELLSQCTQPGLDLFTGQFLEDWGRAGLFLVVSQALYCCSSASYVF